MPFGSTTYEERAPAAGGNVVQTLAGAFKWPLLVAGSTLLATLIWLLWPVGPGGLDGFDLVDAIEPPVPDELILDRTTAAALAATPLFAAHHVIVRGSVRVPAEAILVADRLTFETDARLDAPGGRLIALAPVVEHATIDLSGRDGRDAVTPGAAGADGQTGGITLLAAAKFDGGRVLANGGSGGNGARGYAGAAGRNGWCGPRGFGLAKRGATGGPGGMAGSGGSGGLVTLLYQQQPADVSATHGSAGRPGRGGTGGPGGAGCKGLRGDQPAQPPGNEGAQGRAGSRGEDGTIDKRQIDFDDVVAAFEDWLDDGPHDFQHLRDRLLAIEPIEPT
jgi:hypothetical protein